MFSFKMFPYQDLIKTKELTDHPVRVGSDPECYGKVMGQFRGHMSGPPGNKDGNTQGRNDHGNTQHLPDHTPTDIFYKPENNMHIFHPAITGGDTVERFISLYHVSK